MRNSVASSPTLHITGRVACLVYQTWDRDRSRHCGPQRAEPLWLHRPRHCPSKACQHWQHQREAGMLFHKLKVRRLFAGTKVALAREPGRHSESAGRCPWGSSVGLCRQDGCGPGPSPGPLCTSSTDLPSLVGTHSAR